MARKKTSSSVTMVTCTTKGRQMKTPLPFVAGRIVNPDWYICPVVGTKTSQVVAYQCDFCDYENKSKRALLMHVYHHKSNKTLCKWCEYPATSQANLLKHMEDVSYHGVSASASNRCEPVRAMPFL
jgi:hypothetical protein